MLDSIQYPVNESFQT